MSKLEDIKLGYKTFDGSLTEYIIDICDYFVIDPDRVIDYEPGSGECCIFVLDGEYYEYDMATDYYGYFDSEIDRLNTTTADSALKCYKRKAESIIKRLKSECEIKRSVKNAANRFEILAKAAFARKIKAHYEKMNKDSVVSWSDINKILYDMNDGYSGAIHGRNYTVANVISICDNIILSAEHTENWMISNDVAKIINGGNDNENE